MLDTKKTYIVALAGPSASGKTTIANLQADDYDDSYRWKQMTTRPARSTDEEYVFIDKDTILTLKDNKKLVCYTEFNDNHYGTFIESLAPKFVYVVVSIGGLQDLIESKDIIEMQLTKEVEIVPVLIEYEINEESLNIRGRDRSVEFVKNELSDLTNYDIDWAIRFNSDENSVHDPKVFRKILEEYVSSSEFDRDAVIEQVKQLSDEELQELLQKLSSNNEDKDADNSSEEVVTETKTDSIINTSEDEDFDELFSEDDAVEENYEFLSEIDSVELDEEENELLSDSEEKIEEVANEEPQQEESEALKKLREEALEKERKQQESEAQDKFEEQAQEQIQSNLDRPFNLHTLKATFKDDFLDYTMMQDDTNPEIVFKDDILLESKVASFLRANNMPRDDVEAAETIKVETSSNGNKYTSEIFVKDKFMCAITLDTESNAIV